MIQRLVALIQTTFDGAAKSSFSVLPTEIKKNWKPFTQEFSKILTRKEKSFYIKEFYVMKSVDYQTKRLKTPLKIQRCYSNHTYVHTYIRTYKHHRLIGNHSIQTSIITNFSKKKSRLFLGLS